MFGNGLITAAASNDLFNHIERWHDINGEEVKILGDNEFSTLVGFGMGCVEENSQCEDEALSHPKLEITLGRSLFSKALNSCLPIVTNELECSGPMTSDWVLQIVMGFCHHMDLLCAGVWRGAHGLVYSRRSESLLEGFVIQFQISE
jgi:hypothetical protein